MLNYILKFTTEKYVIEINYVLSVNGQILPSRVRLTQEVDVEFTGRINGTLTLMKGQQMCVNTTAILQVRDISINTYIRSEMSLSLYSLS